MSEPTSLPTGQPVTSYLRDWKDPDPDGAGRVISAVYHELRVMASNLLRSENAGHTLHHRNVVRSFSNASVSDRGRIELAWPSELSAENADIVVWTTVGSTVVGVGRVAIPAR